MRRSLTSTLTVATVLALGLAACGGSSESGNESLVDEAAVSDAAAADADNGDADSAAETGDGLFPDILSAVATEADGSWQFDVTVSSPYDSAERYADGFRILGPDGAEFGFRLLTPDHASEQPFTRSLTGVVIPDGISSVTVEGRDQLNGFGGATVEVDLASR